MNMASKSSAFARTPVACAMAFAMAGTAGMAQANDVYELGEVVVTAARTAQTVDETLAPVTVITREEIERSQATSVNELLNKAPGVQIASNGGPGSNTGVYIRGTKTAQTLIIVDGHKLNNGSNGAASLQYLDPDQIERIEIVRGPRSSLYGADAIGGVIQIITKKGSGKPQLTVKAGVGTQTTGDYSLNYSGEVEGTRFNLGAKLYETQGYDRTNNKLGSDADDDAYRNKSVSGSVSKTINDIELGANFSHSQGKSEFDNGYNMDGSGKVATGRPYSLFKVSTLSTYARADINDIWSTKLDLGYTRDERSDFELEWEDRETINDRYSASWQNDLAWSDTQLLIAGIDYSNERVEGSTNYKEDERYNVGVFAQNTTSFEQSELQLALRQDKNQSYGSNTTGSASWGLDLPKQMKLIATYGTAFRAPTFGDLYGPYSSSNPDLKAETSKNAELELKGKFGKVSTWSVNAYQNDMKDMLEYDGSVNKMLNIDRVRIRGIEFNLATAWQGWALSSNLTFLDPEYTEGVYSGKTLYRRAEKLFNLDADRSFGRWTLGGTFRAQGSTWNDQANTQKVAGFGTVDLRASMQVSPEFKTQLKLVNLMDKEYTTTRGYVDQPRSALVTLIWTPKL